MTITLTVSGRIASVDATAHVVAGNTYPVALSLDSEWTGSLYLRVRFGSLYYDIPFASSDASVDVQMPVGYPEVGIGVFSEALQICTNEARIRLLRSILEAGEQVVEFDSDLYDQWAGEVSELLCDDAFDAESDRPVKNSVITAWKDTVPLDSALVHKTGNETIGGVKTFSEHLNLSKNLNQNSTLGYLEAGNKFQVACYDQKDNASNLFSLSYGAYNAGGAFNSMGTRLYKPDRSGYFAWDTRAYADHMLMMTQPYYPVDGSSNPQALTANALVASGNIAVDPRLVHTTGAESIAGDKTLSGTFSLARADPTVNFKSSTTTAQTGVKANIVFYTSNTVRGQVFQQRDASTEFIALRQQKLVGSGFSELKLRVDSNDVGWAECPSYTADNSADAKIVTRSMLATTPTVVHTTGNENVAGQKTFSGNIIVNGTLYTVPAFVAGETRWVRLYEVTPHNNGGVVRITATAATTSAAPSDISVLIGGSASYITLTAIADGYGIGLVAAKRASDGHVEIWGKKTWCSWEVPYRYRHNIETSDSAVSNDPPAVGDTYSLVVTYGV